jgi:hypothetical protein
MAKKPFSGVSDQSKVAHHRRDDAQALLQQERWRGAMYMAGYAIECTIKAKLMKVFKKRTLEDLEVELKRRGLIPDRTSLFDHRIELYMRASGRLDTLKGKGKEPLWQSFNVANQWLPSWRYNPDQSNRPDAEDFLSAVDTMLKWIRNNI